MSKTKVLRSGFSPQTEKRLIGEINVQKKRNHSVPSNKPPPIERFKTGPIKVPKAADDLSRLTSAQTFNRDFRSLENEVINLRQISCPPTSEIMFDSVADVRSSFLMFENNCKTIMKQKKLNAEVSKKCFDYYRNYVANFFIFADHMENFQKNIYKLYSSSITKLFSEINSCVTNFIEKAMRDPQGRTVIVQYRKYCEDSIKEISNKVVTFVASKDFSVFDEEELENFSETTKTFGRFFEKELAPLIFSIVQKKNRSDKSMIKFHESFVKLVSYITSAPSFVVGFNNVIELLQVCKDDINQIKSDVGDEKILKQLRKRYAQENVEEVDDILPNLNKLIDLFDVKLDENEYYRNSEIIDIVRKTAAKRIDSLNERVEDLIKEKEKPVAVTADQYKDRFEDMRKFKVKIQEKIDEENATFDRNVIYSIRSILTSPKMYTNESHQNQVRIMIDQLKEEIYDYRNQIATLKKNDAKVVELLCGLGVKEDPSIEEVARNTVELVNNEKGSLINHIKEIHDFLIDSVNETTGIDKNELENLESEELIDKMKEYSSQTTEKLRVARSDYANAISCLNLVKKGFPGLFKENESEESIYEAVDKSLDIVKERMSSDEQFKGETVSFVNKVVNSLTIPGAESESTKETVKAIMKDLSLKLNDPHETASLIMDSNPISGMFKDASQYKLLALDVCAKLCNTSKGSLEGRRFDEIKKESLDSIDEYKAIKSLKCFSEVPESVSHSSKNTKELMERLNKEIDESRICNSKLNEIQKILPQISQQLKTNVEDVTNIKEFTEKVSAIKSDDSSIVNAICDDISAINDSICLLITKENEKKKEREKANSEEEEEEEEEEYYSSSYESSSDNEK